MEQAGLGALLVFDNNNIRYLTGVAIGEWTRDKLCRYALYTRTGELVLWDFGSAAVHHRMYCPWLKPENCMPPTPRCAAPPPPASGLTPKQVAEIKDRLEQAGITNEPVGVDFAEVPTFSSCKKQQHRHPRRQQVCWTPGSSKSRDEIALLATAAAMVDGTTPTSPRPGPGSEENEIVALGEQRLYEMGRTRGVGNRSPANGATRTRTTFSDRMIRPGEQAFFDIMHSTTAIGPATTAASRSAGPASRSWTRYKKAREWIDAAIGDDKPGVSTDQVARLWPTAQGDRAAGPRRPRSACCSGTGSASRCTERPIISRLTSLDRPDGDQGGHGLRAGDLLPEPPTGTRPPGSRKRSWSPERGSRS